ncbi:molybdopterin synthase [Halomarina oriensis]|uniref:Molybdopterin synthase n=1 Tax=Halomarina oriensis TaxID=671145 RepID=A0A6B0GG57_9EURY|nr:molybdopterin synthase [Halomarina oriensis]MWG33684.1 molybdopterin synthase [Halomarina oriensis]
MYAVSVVGSDSTALVERLVGRLAVEGRVATVSNLSAPPEPGFEAGVGFRGEGAAVTYGLGDGWTALGHDRSLREVLDDCAPEYDYLLADGFEGTRLPTIVAGEAPTASDTDGALTAVDADDADLDALVGTIEATEPHETLESLVAAAKASPDAERSGAIATFTGRVRAKDAADDARTELLEFEMYEGVAEERMAAISRELKEREGVFEVRMHHRSGVIPDGEDIVFVVVLAGHRGEAFRTVSDGIDRLKAEVPIFKKEVTTDEEFWVHDRS